MDQDRERRYSRGKRTFGRASHDLVCIPVINGAALREGEGRRANLQAPEGERIRQREG